MNGMDDIKASRHGRPRSYSDDGFMQLLIVMIVHEEPTFLGLKRFLLVHPDICKKCGFDTVPSRRTLSRRLQRLMPPWMRKKFDHEKENQKQLA